MKLGQLSGRRRDTQEINMAPLIDMVFILLIFFMATTTFVRDAELDIDRPGAETAQTADNRALRVTLGRRGELFVDARPVKPWMLQARVRDALKGHHMQRVLLVADRRVDTGRLVEVVDQCRLAGAKDVGVAVEREI
ncbi:MAG: biopolymer transporter ExbD [Deltaproteobacteria bacterium RIFOXYA12_FULL_58_15]|nr:MAG: biopolymer transporter ExbD [Deltaproteobacteria bacterium RIFOXYA12_FULL_58_15]OGR11932.1 MAG: biopolymer transporter ExbD [Deltaproteobacteria bacterium RIFOXYB12_FULL_58_9]